MGGLRSLGEDPAFPVLLLSVPLHIPQAEVHVGGFQACSLMGVERFLLRLINLLLFPIFRTIFYSWPSSSDTTACCLFRMLAISISSQSLLVLSRAHVPRSCLFPMISCPGPAHIPPFQPQAASPCLLTSCTASPWIIFPGN